MSLINKQLDEISRSLDNLERSQTNLRVVGAAALARYEQHMRDIAALQASNDECETALERLYTLKAALEDRLYNESISTEELDNIHAENQQLQDQMRRIGQQLLKTQNLISMQQTVLEDAKNQFERMVF